MNRPTWLRGMVLSGLVSLALLGGGSPGPASACSCMPPKPPLEALSKSPVVFAGIALRCEATLCSADGTISSADPTRYFFRVTHAWKGVVTDTVVVTTARMGASCGYDFQIGRHYVLYTWKRAGSTVLRVSLCSRTRPIERAGADIATLPEPLVLADDVPLPEVRVVELAELVRGPDPAKRYDAALALGQIGSRGDLDISMPALLALSRSEEPVFRRVACEAFGYLGAAGRDAVPRLIELEEDPIDGVRQAATMALGNIGGEEAIHHLTDTVRRSDGTKRSRALNSLARNETDTDKVLPFLIHLLDHADPSLRQHAIGCLGWKRSHAGIVVPLLEDVLDTGNEFERRRAIWALGWISSPVAQARLLDVARSGPEHDQALALDALSTGDSPVKEVVFQLAMELLQDPRESVRVRAITTLGRLAMNGAEVVPVLVDFMDQGTEEERSKAIMSVAAFGADAVPAIPVLTRVAEQDNGLNQTLAEISLEALAEFADPQ